MSLFELLKAERTWGWAWWGQEEGNQGFFDRVLRAFYPMTFLVHTHQVASPEMGKLFTNPAQLGFDDGDGKAIPWAAGKIALIPITGGYPFWHQ